MAQRVKDPGTVTAAIWVTAMVWICFPAWELPHAAGAAINPKETPEFQTKLTIETHRYQAVTKLRDVRPAGAVDTAEPRPPLMTAPLQWTVAMWECGPVFPDPLIFFFQESRNP